MAHPRNELSLTDLQAFLTDWDSGMALAPLAFKWQMSRNRAKRLLEVNQRKFEPRKASGPRSPRWNGGRGYDSKGYVWVLLPKGHKFEGMAGERRRVLEHRLVMANHLGRNLEPGETVHHRNGKKDDNKIENLELRLGPHGPGQVYRCADCNSVNIIAEPLTTKG